MAELKTKENDGDVQAFMASIEPESKRNDSMDVLAIMRDATGEEARMWGKSIVGFGKYHYKYESGREGEWMRVGFAARKQSLTLYIMPGFDHYDKLLSQLGKYTLGKSCLYIKKLADVDQEVLFELVRDSDEFMKGKYAESNKAD